MQRARGAASSVEQVLQRAGQVRQVHMLGREGCSRLHSLSAGPVRRLRLLSTDVERRNRQRRDEQTRVQGGRVQGGGGGPQGDGLFQQGGTPKEKLRIQFAGLISSYSGWATDFNGVDVLQLNTCSYTIFDSIRKLLLRVEYISCVVRHVKSAWRSFHICSKKILGL
uniref:Uncharacterized protein n=1 Tax=Setaria viridis TaxID=4556 RepID=A0A4U6TRQ7_SETVI|nr:hypothetical protein SEVIR_7G061800v2 [Setaria viridis]